MIVENYFMASSNTDILAAPSRLAAIPYDGTLILEMMAQTCDGTNYFEVTVQLPDGSTPLLNTLMSAGTGGSAAIMKADEKFVFSTPVQAGGHVLIDATEFGTSSFQMRATLVP